MLTFAPCSTRFETYVYQGLLDIHCLEKDNLTELEEADDFKFQIKNWLQQVSNQPASLIIIALKDDQAVGFIMGMVEPQTNQFSRYKLHGLIQALYVNPNHRRQGIGQQLVEQLEMAFIEHRVPYCDLSYHPKNITARKFWKKLGFIPAQIISRKFLHSGSFL